MGSWSLLLYNTRCKNLKRRYRALSGPSAGASCLATTPTSKTLRSNSTSWPYVKDAGAPFKGKNLRLACPQNRLADKETQGLERDLVLAETLKLCNRTQAQLDTGQGRTLKAATSVRDYQLKLEDLNRKLMAVVSELSMYQAKALQEQQQLEDLRENVATAQANMLAGKAPNEEVRG